MLVAGPATRSKPRRRRSCERYCGAIYRYALKVLGEADLAEEACQEFALRFVRGDFRHADPAKGRFSDYVKTAVIHLLNEVRRREQDRRRAIALESGVVEAVLTPPPVEPEDSEFQQLWRKELLNRAWHEMERQQPASGPPYHAVLRIKADQPDLTAADLADTAPGRRQGNVRRFGDAPGPPSGAGTVRRSVARRGGPVGPVRRSRRAV